MLVLTRKTQEKIQIGDSITVTILRVKGQAVRLGIEAPEGVRILRGELLQNTADEDAETSDAAPAETAPRRSQLRTHRERPGAWPANTPSLLQFRAAPTSELV